MTLRLKIVLVCAGSALLLLAIGERTASFFALRRGRA